mmetsp:Transcript_96240/g.310508  ORF Transcript_96240/g.310508 Transcript_96240/m.310508 type:complete len:292 (+) Transcript_96240:276-1151(+)
MPCAAPSCACKRSWRAMESPAGAPSKAATRGVPTLTTSLPRPDGTSHACTESRVSLWTVFPSRMSGCWVGSHGSSAAVAFVSTTWTERFNCGKAHPTLFHSVSSAGPPPCCPRSCSPLHQHPPSCLQAPLSANHRRRRRHRPWWAFRARSECSLLEVVGRTCTWSPFWASRVCSHQALGASIRRLRHSPLQVLSSLLADCPWRATCASPRCLARTSGIPFGPPTWRFRSVEDGTRCHTWHRASGTIASAFGKAPNLSTKCWQPTDFILSACCATSRLGSGSMCLPRCTTIS